MTIYESLIPDLKKISDALKKKADASLKELGVTNGQAQLITELYSKDSKHMTMKEIEKHFHVSQATVAGVVSRLKKKGLVDSYKDENDKRIKHVALTEKGCELAALVKLKMEETDALPTAGLSEDEQIQLKNLVEKVKETVV